MYAAWRRPTLVEGVVVPLASGEPPDGLDLPTAVAVDQLLGEDPAAAGACTASSTARPVAMVGLVELRLPKVSKLPVSTIRQSWRTAASRAATARRTKMRRAA
jgi:hypothetical protein